MKKCRVTNSFHRNSLIVLVLMIALAFSACKTSSVTPTKAIESDVTKLTYKRTPLNREELKTWYQMDLLEDSIPGFSLDKAKEFTNEKKAEITPVAVIDSGIDIQHPLFSLSVWLNEEEVASNGIDDDQNGYVDDLNGWNFLGDIIHAPYASTRLVAKGDVLFDRSSENDSVVNNSEFYSLYRDLKENNDRLFEAAKESAERYSKAVKGGEVSDRTIESARRRSISYKYHYNTSFNPRTTLGDNLEDIDDKSYGDMDVSPKSKHETHGTHVSGIIALVTKPFGVDVPIIPIRAVPDGDEYDKDIALAIQYAVDNGAKVINMSFGKNYSKYPEWVYEAIQYASDNDVLIVHAAGNDSKNIDTVMVFPNDHKGTSTEFVDNFISVGSISRFYNKKLLAFSSNYGKQNVDVFAPGDEILSSVLEDTWDYVSATNLGPYDFQSGTSMAAPMVSAVAALIRAYYPDLSAKEVKQIIMQSGVSIDFPVVLPRTYIEEKPFEELCKSGRILNAYNALKMADEMNERKQNISN